jgi:hypothetical protein
LVKPARAALGGLGYATPEAMRWIDPAMRSSRSATACAASTARQATPSRCRTLTPSRWRRRPSTPSIPHFRPASGSWRRGACTCWSRPPSLVGSGWRPGRPFLGGREACPPASILNEGPTGHQRAHQALLAAGVGCPSPSSPSSSDAPRVGFPQVERAVRLVDRLSTVIELSRVLRVRVDRPDRPAAVPGARRWRPLRGRGWGWAVVQPLGAVSLLSTRLYNRERDAS